MKSRFSLIFVLSLFCVQSWAITFQEAKNLATARNYERAVVAFRGLIQQPQYAKNAECNKFYGQCLCMLGHYEESLKYLEIGAKGRISGAWWYLGISRQHLYDFDGAIEALEKYKSLCSANSSWIPRTDSIIAECRIGQRGVNRVQDVVIIDSLMVEKHSFFAHFKLGHESGRLVSDSIFENVAGDFRLLVDSTGISSSSFFEGEWTAPERIESIGGENCRVGYPFQRSDGETLYFACDSTPGFGGMDIYMTTFNSESDSYFTPTRLGMPFNSPFNDYMFAVDETNQVGWWATERNAAPGFVCIYVFILDEEAEYLDGENISRARIDAISETWKEENYDALLDQIRNPMPIDEKSDALFIPIREGLVYSSVDDFRNSEARTAFCEYMVMQENLSLSKEDLAVMRNEYAKASPEEKDRLKPQILQREAQIRRLHSEVKAAEKNFRRLELDNNK